MPNRWIVVMEVAADPTEGAIEIATVQRLLGAVALTWPVALHNPERLALQVQVSAPSMAEALFSALCRWREAVTAVGCGLGEVVRAEVLTLAEFARDCDLAAENPTVHSLFEWVDRREEAIGGDLLRRALDEPAVSAGTGSSFREQVQLTLRRPGGRSAAVLWVDVEPAPGAGATDSLAPPALQDAVTPWLAGTLPAGASAACLDRDAVAVLLDEADEERAVAVAHRLLDRLQDSRATAAAAVKATIGVALTRPDQSADELLHDAWIAMRTAKRAGGQPWAVYRPPALEPAPSRIEGGGLTRAEAYACMAVVERAALVARECRTLEEAAAALLGEVCGRTSMVLGHLLLTHGSAELVSTGTWHVSDPVRHHPVRTATEGARFAFAVDLPGRAFATRRVAWTADVVTDPSCTRRAVLAEAGLGTAVAVPVLTGAVVAGVVELFAEGTGEPDPRLVSALAVVGTALGRVAERARAHATRWSAQRYEIFGWEPLEPGPSLDEFLAHPQARAPVGEEVRRTLSRTFQQLAGLVEARDGRGTEPPTQ